MTGISDLKTLLASMKPELQPGEFIFCSVPHDQKLPADIEPLGMFLEKEGRTLIVEADTAARLDCLKTAPMRCISLTVHSTFEAVGLTAAFSTELSRHGISANVVAGYYHDHIFVPSADAERAAGILKALSKSSVESSSAGTA